MAQFHELELIISGYTTNAHERSASNGRASFSRSYAILFLERKFKWPTSLVGISGVDLNTQLGWSWLWADIKRKCSRFFVGLKTLKVCSSPLTSFWKQRINYLINSTILRAIAVLISWQFPHKLKLFRVYICRRYQNMEEISNFKRSGICMKNPLEMLDGPWGMFGTIHGQSPIAYLCIVLPQLCYKFCPHQL